MNDIDAERYGPWAVIAGGSEGIDSSIAADLAQAGINIVLIARKVEPLEAVAADLRARTAVEVRTLSVDLTDDAMLDRVRDVTDDIEIGPFVNWKLEDVVKVIRLNTLGQFDRLEQRPRSEPRRQIVAARVLRDGEDPLDTSEHMDLHFLSQPGAPKVAG